MNSKSGFQSSLISKFREVKFWTFSFFLGLALAVGISFAWNAVWHGTDWVQSGKIITPKEIAENLEYLNQKVNTLEQNSTSSSTGSGLYPWNIINFKTLTRSNSQINLGKPGTDWNMIRVEKYYKKYFYNNDPIKYLGSGYIISNNDEVSIYLDIGPDSWNGGGLFYISNLGTQQRCYYGRGSKKLLCFWLDNQGELMMYYSGWVDNWRNPEYGHITLFFFK